jgi:hypothetical protein
MGQDETLETDPVQLLGAIRQYFDAKGNRALDEFNLKDTLGAAASSRSGCGAVQMLGRLWAGVQLAGMLGRARASSPCEAAVRSGPRLLLMPRAHPW